MPDFDLSNMFPAASVTAVVVTACLTIYNVGKVVCKHLYADLCVGAGMILVGFTLLCVGGYYVGPNGAPSVYAVHKEGQPDPLVLDQNKRNFELRVEEYQRMIAKSNGLLAAVLIPSGISLLVFGFIYGGTRLHARWDHLTGYDD